jgi:hypothetical protein
VNLAVLARPLVALIAGQALGAAHVDFTLVAPLRNVCSFTPTSAATCLSGTPYRTNSTASR